MTPLSGPEFDRAVAAIQSGKLVGLPTETVYGIGCDAMNEAAVRSVFALKGRPAENPLIVHLPQWEWVERVCAEFPPIAQHLAVHFWPGPLTMVLPKRRDVPDVVTAGLSTVAVRVPKLLMTRFLIESAGTPIAAPSANRFMGLSPARAGDVAPEIVAGLEVVLDGGPCEIGIESTVIDLTAEPYRLLRPGGLSRTQLERITGPLAGPIEGMGKPAPGMYRRHYSPRAEVRIVEHVGEGATGLVFGAPAPNQIGMPTKMAPYARRLYHVLHELDASGVDVIEVEAPPAGWEAVWDRLRKASAR